eukprot:3850994-Lingulodinium_polyedra.AAC.1
MSIARNQALQGVFVAHWKAWMRSASNGDHGALVLEDDCAQHREIPPSRNYLLAGITWWLCE